MIGILALQGAFAEHQQLLAKLGVPTKFIRAPKDFTTDLKGLIIPGGESTVMTKQLINTQLLDVVKTAIEEGLPTFGTCAGMILLASDGPLAVLDAKVKRNAYGRQLGSFQIKETFGDFREYPMVFIRAPYITEAANLEILARVAGNIVAVRQNNVLATAFHPELTADTRVHEYFLKMIEN